MAWSPVGSVFKQETPQTERLKTLLIALVAKYEAPADVILFAWIIQHPAGIIPVSGSIKSERLINQMKAKDIQLEPEDWFAIWTESMGEKVP